MPEAEGKRSEDGAAVVERVAREWRRLWRRALLTGAIAVAALSLGIFALWYSVTQCIVPMDSGDYAYLNTCVLESGEICVEAGLNRACRNTIYFEKEEDGDHHM